MAHWNSNINVIALSGSFYKWTNKNIGNFFQSYWTVKIKERLKTFSVYTKKLLSKYLSICLQVLVLRKVDFVWNYTYTLSTYFKLLSKEFCVTYLSVYFVYFHQGRYYGTLKCIISVSVRVCIVYLQKFNANSSLCCPSVCVKSLVTAFSYPEYFQASIKIWIQHFIKNIPVL